MRALASLGRRVDLKQSAGHANRARLSSWLEQTFLNLFIYSFVYWDKDVFFGFLDMGVVVVFVSRVLNDRLHAGKVPSRVNMCRRHIKVLSGFLRSYIKAQIAIILRGIPGRGRRLPRVTEGDFFPPLLLFHFPKANETST